LYLSKYVYKGDSWEEYAEGSVTMTTRACPDSVECVKNISEDFLQYNLTK